MNVSKKNSSEKTRKKNANEEKKETTKTMPKIDEQL